MLITLATFFSIAALRRGAAALFGAALSIVAAAQNVGAADAGMMHFRCINETSGASWLVVVDLDRGLVDSRTATITDSRIKWIDPHGGVYELERATGKLSLRGASTTGGYFLHYLCRPE